MALLHYELTEKILEACFEVSNDFGAGFLESVYRKALLLVLEQKGLQARPQVPLKVYFRGTSVGEFFADVIVEEKVLLELKAVQTLCAEHQAQAINYLKATGIDVGLLINFGRSKLEFRRVHR